MREYYGELSNCLEYIEDENHRAIPWKDYEFSFELRNSTNYTLELKRRGGYHSFATVKARGKIRIKVDNWKDEEILVSAKEDLTLKCNFEMKRGCMIKRNLVEYMEDKVYIAPIFKNGVVTIATCEDCGPNFGAKPEYKVIPLEKPAREVEICNFTPYDLIISTKNTVIQRIEANKKGNEGCSSKFVGIPCNGTLYIDTVFEEITWKDSNKVYEDAILRVNGCCIKVKDGSYFEDVSVIGPALSEPYIRHLYANFGKTLKNEGDINVWCNTIDYWMD